MDEDLVFTKRFIDCVQRPHLERNEQVNWCSHASLDPRSFKGIDLWERGEVPNLALRGQFAWCRCGS